MAEFPVSALEQHLLEKIIQKLEFKSYYNLQCTCSHMLEFVQTTPGLKLSIHSNRNYQLIYSRITCSWECSIYENNQRYPTNSIFGLRVDYLLIASDIDEEIFLNPRRVKSLCDFLKKHQITCVELALPPDAGITKEEYRTVVNIVKPQIIEMFTESSDIYDALLHPKLDIMERVELYIDEEVFVDVLHKFLPTFPELVLTVFCFKNPVSMIRSSLKILEQPLPNLREFIIMFHYNDRSEPFCKEVMDQMFRKHKMTIEKDGDSCATIKLPKHFPPGSICRYGRDMMFCDYFSVKIPSRGERIRQRKNRD